MHVKCITRPTSNSLLKHRVKEHEIKIR